VSVQTKNVTKTKIPEEVKQALLKTNLAYLWNLEEAKEYTLTEDTQAVVWKNGRVEYYRKNVEKGTKGWLFTFPKVTYSKYEQIGDQNWPAKGADIIQHGANYQFVALLEDGTFAESFKSVKFDEPQIIGKV